MDPNQDRAVQAAFDGYMKLADLWQPIETAPRDKPVLLWWIGIKGAKGPATAAIGQISSYESWSVWDGQAYRPIDWFTHWMPLPPAPTAGQE